MIVVDANIIAYLILPGEKHEAVKKAFFRDPDWNVPLLWRSEVRNILSLHVKKGMLKLGDAHRIMAQAEDLLDGKEYQVPSLHVLQLCEESGCAAYDCEYVALARDLESVLLTTDGELLRSFPSRAISLDAYLKSNP